MLPVDVLTVNHASVKTVEMIDVRGVVPRNHQAIVIVNGVHFLSLIGDER